jgi:hypothetical protein
LDKNLFIKADNPMSESWDPVLFTKADDSIFDKLYYQHSLTKADNSMSESWDPILFTKADDSIFDKLSFHAPGTNDVSLCVTNGD